MSLANNKTAYHNYEISDTFVAGMVLSGPEVKAAKAGQIDLKGAYAAINDQGEAWLYNCYIAAYKPARVLQKDYDPNQPRKLLLTKKEISFLIGRQKEKGISLVPVEIFLAHNLIKIKVGLGRGKKNFDKREAIKKRDFERRKQKIIKD